MNPIRKLTWLLMASSTPARPVRAVPRIQTAPMTLSTFMPDDADSAGLSETARMALPRRVFISSTQEMVMVTSAMPMIASSLSARLMKP